MSSNFHAAKKQFRHTIWFHFAVCIDEVCGNLMLPEIRFILDVTAAVLKFE